ncbi:hypothetical protein DM01DRAFT_1403058 [Hesseltinella vesiculosa]|uniref:Nucleic acid-binding protein n=1 Tax=Hesseltinella vesiculosa TaxID=101127 RepID=A0A1X2GX16_9FUNG|nr:hypothetical protein DM01DRAFT_1403058 [Hesseltinella vesiculosa]
MAGYVNKQPTQLVLLKDVRPNMSFIECEVIVLQQEEVINMMRKNDIYKYLVADRTGCMVLMVYAERGMAVRPGDILHIKGLDARFRNNVLLLIMNKSGTISRIGQDTLVFAEGPNFSEMDFGQNFPVPFSRSNQAAGHTGGNTPPPSRTKGAIQTSGSTPPPNRSRATDHPSFAPPSSSTPPPPRDGSGTNAARPSNTVEAMHHQLPAMHQQLPAMHQQIPAMPNHSPANTHRGRGGYGGRGRGNKRLNAHPPDDSNQASVRRKVEYNEI